MNDCWPARRVDGVLLLRLHKRRPIKPSTAAPRTPPTTPPTSATLLLLFPFPVSLVAAIFAVVVVDVGVLFLLASLSTDLELTLATLSNDACLTERLEIWESSERKDERDAIERLLERLLRS
jgi:hypothetical protein